MHLEDISSIHAVKHIKKNLFKLYNINGVALRFPKVARDLFFLYSVHTGTGSHAAFYQIPPEVKLPELKADHAPISIA